MSIKIITADERVKMQSGIKGQIWGRYGVGKTSLLHTLDPKTTLAIDLEAGMKAVQDWKGDSISIRSWEDARDISCWLGGPQPALRSDQAYSQTHYDYVVEQLGDPQEKLSRYQTVFIDSTTNASAYCLHWAKGQPEAISERTGKVDMRGAYGLLGKELVAWMTQWQYIPDLNVWFVGGLEEKQDDFNRRFWSPMIEGSKGAAQLPYIVDEVITMIENPEDADASRVFFCQPNTHGFPAKDRSGRLNVMEEPHLGRLMEKIQSKEKPIDERFKYVSPETDPVDPDTQTEVAT